MPSRSASLDDAEPGATSFELAPIRKKIEKLGDAGDSTLDDDHEDDDHDPGRRSTSTNASIESFELYTPDEERTVLRKLDWHVVVFMAFLYLLSFLDRSNIGNAKIAGLMEDLDMTDDQFEWLLTGFYITYILFEWMILLYHILSPRIYIAVTVFSWGILASLQSLSTSFSHMLILRLFLGISEAAFSPGVPYYLSFFYRREELALRAGMQVSAAPLAASFAGSLAWLITKLGENGPFAPWRLLFLVEGFPSVIVAVVAWNVVPDNAETAWFLTARERRIAKTRLERQRGEAASTGSQSVNTAPKQRVDWREIWNTMRDPKCYITALMFLNCNIAFSSMPVFLPSVVHEMGFTSLASQGLSAPPFLFSFIVVLITAKLSDSFRTRSPFVLLHALIACIAYLAIALGGALGWPNFLRYVFVYPACAGFFSAITVIITWTMNNQPSRTGKGVGMTILNLVGQCGPLLGTRLYPDRDAPAYISGMLVCGCAMGLVAGLTLVLRWVLTRENERNARKWETEQWGGDEDGEEAQPLAGGEVNDRPLRADGLGGKADAKDRFVLML